MVKKKTTKKKVAKQICVCCKNNSAELQINDKEWICKDCAQYANDQSVEI